MPPTKVDPSTLDISDARYCHFHRRIQHPTVDCFNPRMMFQKKLEIGEIEMNKAEDSKATQHNVLMLSHDPSGDVRRP